jgi:hypothetical protein
MWVTHHTLGAALDGRYLIDLLGTGLLGGLAYLAAYIAVGLTPAERRGATALIARVRPR